MKNKHYSIIGFLAVGIFWITYFIMANQRPKYSYLSKAISELGSVDAPNKWYWNIVGYIIPGMLIAIFGFGLHKNLASKNSSKLPLIGIVLSGLFMSFSGIFPGDFDNKESLTMLLHTLGSFGSYIFFLIGAFTYPKLMKTSTYWKKAIKPTLTFTWLTILFGSWAFIFPNIPAAGQRIVFAFYFIWVLFNAYKLYKRPRTEIKNESLPTP
ncbi:DUF998 domain-containing protein [Aquimarina algicola]|uniref:DUF998 domain-containing protein n=1 Tax=Aquimarina algicola TaxID=2589995 RepID=A0A504JHE8_9FLAO|nr:DUF998 domain-containing protein [Aquimarina algicola]TPN85861.1 DUF998 domain-containing protein [Aquimarina algicola]